MMQQVEVGKRQTAAKQPSTIRKWLSQWEIQTMIWPGILFLIVMVYVPMWGVILAFKEYDIFQGPINSPWVGLRQFELFFQSPDFWMVMRNTIVISFLKLVIIFPAPIILALMLNEVRNLPFKRTIQTITYLPHFISWVIVSGLVFSLLSVDNGSLNNLLVSLGVIREPINWMQIPEYFYGILIASGLWKEIGFSSIVYLAAIVGVNPSLYEAASIDGAGRIRKIVSVTLPSIMPVITIFLILNIGNMLSAGFEDILALTNNGNNAILRNVSEVLDTYVYSTGINNQRYSYATAVGMFKSIINIGLLWGANALTRRMGGSSLW